MCSQTAPVRDHMASVRHGFCYLWWEMSAHRTALPLLGTGIIATCTLLLWQCISMIATHFSCFRSIAPRPPSLADITCQAQRWTTWPCGFCHLFPRAAGKEASKFKPIKWSVITLGKNDPTSCSAGHGPPAPSAGLRPTVVIGGVLYIVMVVC